MRHLNNLTADYLNTGFKTQQYLSDYYIEEAQLHPFGQSIPLV